MCTGVPAGKVATWPSGICTASHARLNSRATLSMLWGWARKPENDGVPKNHPGSKRDGREFRAVGGIGEMLRFQTKTGAFVIDLAAFAFDRSVEMISCIELQ